MAEGRRWILCGQIVPEEVYAALPFPQRKIIRRATMVAEATMEALREVVQRDDPGHMLPALQATLDEHGIPQVAGKGPHVTACVLFQDGWPFCPRNAGAGTANPGTGPCRWHGGQEFAQRRKGAVVTAHAIARIMDVDPWEALIVAMRRAYAWSAFYQAKLASVTDDEDLRPGGDAYDWVRGAKRTTEAAAKYAKMALDAGVAERQVQTVELQGRLIAQVLGATLAELDLGAETEAKAREIMEMSLRALAESGRADVIAGELA